MTKSTATDTSWPLVISASWTAFTLLIHLLFTLVILKGLNVYLFELPSRIGSSSALLEPAAAARITTIGFISMGVVTLIIAILLVLRKTMAAAVISIIQVLFGFIFLAAVIGNIVEHTFNSTLLTISAVTLLLTLVIISLTPISELTKKFHI